MPHLSDHRHDEPTQKKEDSTVIHLRASSIGSCPTALLAELTGAKGLPTSERMQGLYDRGNAHEAECVEAMGTEGWKTVPWTTYDQDQPYVKAEGEGWYLDGHLDGIMVPPVQYVDRMVEIKAPSTWASFERAVRTNTWTNPYMVQIAWQVSTYMHLTGLEGVIACVEDGRLKTFGIEVTPIPWSTITARCDGLTADVQAGQLAKSCPHNDFGCAYPWLHVQPEVVEDWVLDALASEYEEARAAEAAAKAVKEEVRDKLLAHGGAETSAYKVTVSESTRGSYDWAAIKAAGIDLTPFRSESTSTSVRVTPREKSDG